MSVVEDPIMRQYEVGDVITIAKTVDGKNVGTYNDVTVSGHPPAKFRVKAVREDGSVEVDFLAGGTRPVPIESRTRGQQRDGE